MSKRALAARSSHLSRVSSASLAALIRKIGILLQFAFYATLIVGVTYVLTIGLGLLGSTLRELVVIEEQQGGPPPRRINMPLPPVIQPPADPTRDPRFVNWALKREDSFITLGAPSGTTDFLVGPSEGASDSIVILAPHED